MFQLLSESILDSGVPILGLAFGFDVTYLFLSAKRPVHLTSDELQILWLTHKKNSDCKAKNLKNFVQTAKPLVSSVNVNINKFKNTISQN